MAQGLENAVWPARLELVRRNPDILLDGGHNPQCMAALHDALEELYPGKKMIFLTGVLGDKDYPDMINKILPLAKSFVTITPDSPRALSAQELADYLAADRSALSAVLGKLKKEGLIDYHKNQFTLKNQDSSQS